LSANVRSNTASVSSSNAVSKKLPALLTSVSSGPSLLAGRGDEALRAGDGREVGPDEVAFGQLAEPLRRAGRRAGAN
jgi:hypothetical protein